MQPILKIDLTTGVTEHYDVPKEWKDTFLGGSSLAARLLYEQLEPALDPLSAEAPLLFLTGPLTGTSGPAVGRFVVCGLSPATGLWGESNCGGFWGPELRKTGYDGLWIQGRADHPVYIWIQDGKVEILNAKHLWGKDTYQTQASVEEELNAGSIRVATTGKVRVAAIGVAGELLIPFASILCDHGRAAGRTGMGAVMGAKNLKAIAVQGHGKIPVIDPSSYSPLRSQANRSLHNDSMTQVLRELGTSGAAEYFDYLGEMPKRYFHRERFDEELRVTGASLKETILTGVSACHACVIACGRVVTLEDGEKRKGPEYETLMGFGPNLWVNDPAFVTRMGELCDRYGMDTISVSGTIGLAFHLFDLGSITSTDTGGLDLEWCSTAVIEQLVHQVARREGFGAYLAEGSRTLGQRYGAEDEAVQVNGLEVAYHDPRGSSGMALVYATSPRGACHNQSDYFFVDMGQVEPTLGMEYFTSDAGAEKAANVVKHQDWRTVFNSLVLCFFANLPPETVLSLINTAVGLEWSLVDMIQAGERAWNLKRAINNRLGLTRANDTLPKALLKPYPDTIRPDGPFVPEFTAMLNAYYDVRGWDLETGFPSQEKLLELGLDWVANDLYSDQ